MREKVMSIRDAIGWIPSDAAIGTGGILMTRKPVGLLAEVVRAGRTGLRLWTLLGSIDVELLAAHGCLAQTNTIYVGFEQLGSAPAFDAAVADGTVEAREFSELLMLSGLRASLAGLPFLPTRGATGSDIARNLGIRTVTDPYTGERLPAAPAIRPDVALLHAEAADERGTILGPADRDFLFDFDANLARASQRVIVSVERLVSRDEAAARSRDVLLFPHEVDAVVVLPGGASPSALPSGYAPDVAATQRYLRRARGADPRAAIGDLVAV